MYHALVIKVPVDDKYSYGVVNLTTNQSSFMDNFRECLTKFDGRASYSDPRETLEQFLQRITKQDLYVITQHPTLQHIYNTYPEHFI